MFEKIKTKKRNLDQYYDKIKQIGYAFIQILHCKTGPEIVVYQTNQQIIHSAYYFLSEEVKTVFEICQ